MTKPPPPSAWSITGPSDQFTILLRTFSGRDLIDPMCNYNTKKFSQIFLARHSMPSISGIDYWSIPAQFLCLSPKQVPALVPLKLRSQPLAVWGHCLRCQQSDFVVASPAALSCFFKKTQGCCWSLMNSTLRPKSLPSNIVWQVLSTSTKSCSCRMT